MRSVIFFITALFFAAAAGAGTPPCLVPALGAETTNISDRLREAKKIPDFVAGALVRTVQPRGPAARAGLQAGDVIQAVGSDLVQNVCGFRSAIERSGCRQVRLVVRREEATMKIDVRLVEASSLPGPKGDDQAACKSGDGAACTRLAKAHDDAPDLLQLACDLGDAEGCYLLALKIGNNRKGAAAYLQACDGGNALACTNLGWMYDHGTGVSHDNEMAARLYERGCAGSRCTGPNNLGCVNLGRLYRDGLGVKEDKAAAFRLFRDVCNRRPREGDAEDAGHIARACSLAGTALLFGEGVTKSIPSALSLLEKGCAAADTFGCYNLGTVYENGDVVPQDKPRAIGYYQRACDQGDTEACERAKALRSPPPS